MELDLTNVPEYEIFKDLTTLDEMYGRVIIDPQMKPKYFKPEERKEAFKEVLRQFKQNGFDELYNQFLDLYRNKLSYGYKTMDNFNNFAFNHPLVAMLHMFIEQGLITRDLEYGDRAKIINLGEKILTYDELKSYKISEGIIFADGTLLRILSSEAHKIGALWMFLNGRTMSKAVRYTTDCLNPEPIFLSMGEYAVLENNEVLITTEQAYALYNIYQATCVGRNVLTFEQVIQNSTDLCVTPNGNCDVRLANATKLERALGEDIFNKRKVFEELRTKRFLIT